MYNSASFFVMIDELLLKHVEMNSFPELFHSKFRTILLIVQMRSILHCYQTPVLCSNESNNALCSEGIPSLKRYVCCIVFRGHSFAQTLRILHCVQRAFLRSNATYDALCSEGIPSFKCYVCCIVFRGHSFVQTLLMMHCVQRAFFRSNATYAALCLELSP